MRKVICLTVLCGCLCVSRGALADSHRRKKLIVEPTDVAYAKQANGGSTRSKLMLLNDPKASPCPASIKLSREELDKLAAWIDMVVPYCGDYVEANAWSEDAMRRAKKRIALNKEAGEIDLRNIREYIKSGQ